jgi:hypothetical protein
MVKIGCADRSDVFVAFTECRVVALLLGRLGPLPRSSRVSGVAGV